MSRKKQEIALQEDMESNEAWEALLNRPGVAMVDVYQMWCGPCKVIIPFFRKMKTDINKDEYLHFATACANNIPILNGFIGSCKPCFLVFGGGELVGMIRKTNVPEITKLLFKAVMDEQKIEAGEAIREVIEVAEYVLPKQSKTPEETSIRSILDVEPVTTPPDRPFTVAIIKPDVVREGRVDEVLKKIKDAGIDIIEYMERHLSEDEAASFYYNKRDESYYKELVKFMASGPSHVLVLARDGDANMIQEWRDLLGPTTVEDAKMLAPASLRAEFGTEGMLNALHGSDTKDAAFRELAFFFPDFKMNEKFQDQDRTQNERTLALIRPEAYRDNKDAILDKIKEAGFAIALQREFHLSREQAEEFYSAHKGQDFFEELVKNMSSGPLMALALVRDAAIRSWRAILGPANLDEAKAVAPDSLRAQFAADDSIINPLHGADTPEAAAKELDFFFPKQRTIAVIKPDAYEKKEEIVEKIKQAGFNITAEKDTDLTSDIVSLFYKDNEGKPFFDDLSEHMKSGKTVVMVLSKENAVSDWKELLGPTDPEQAREVNPESFRAVYGTDILANAIHGASTEEAAAKVIQEIFDENELKAADDNTSLKKQKIPSATSSLGEDVKPPPEMRGDEGEVADASYPATAVEPETEAGQEIPAPEPVQGITVSEEPQASSAPETDQTSLAPEGQTTSAPEPDQTSLAPEEVQANPVDATEIKVDEAETEPEAAAAPEE